ncbi:NAD-dependent epimerase/dehydratase family protein [Sphaerotilus microaerophilus]|uniref:NAD-dependent dehydratase n=1 Tax=Sphaerotilus microaerophilus TaxID=2914710 RepID=A0ABM7YKL4_9BURK|nr:NAD(P)-dependent oxidoreductase [Sphaerotilus sp. FB-5]BDI04960.1 NAD-dependent dehydratase [Sphaerotilus sp. FB-5]
MTPLTHMAQGPRRRILVTGAAGYIGSALVRDLLELGHEVVAVDTMVFGERGLHAVANHPGLTVRRMDVRGLQREHLGGIHAIVDLAGIGDARAAELDPAWTHAVNHLARVRLAQLAPTAGVQRYILASSCCVYGNDNDNGRVNGSGVDTLAPSADDSPLDESSPTHPVGAYALANLKAEAAVLPLARPGFAPTVLRLATCHGLAPRTRFDLIANAMAEQALGERRITLPDAADTWHPLLQIDDASQAIIATLGAPLTSVARQIFNVGAGNLRTAEIARTVQLVLGSHITIQAAPLQARTASPPGRRIDFDKFTHLLGWRPQRELMQSVASLVDALDAGRVDSGPATRTQRWYEQALSVTAHSPGGQHAAAASHVPN